MPPRRTTIPLFESSHSGYGDEHRTQAFRYHRTHGSVDARWPRQIRMGLRIRSLVANNHDSAPIFAVEWEDTAGNPRVYYVVDNQIRYLQNGANAQAGGENLVATATGAMFESSGETSGEPFLYTCYGGSGTNYIQKMNRAGTISQSTDVVADKLAFISGYSYRSIIPTSGTQPCQISVIPPGNDRFVNSNWGTGVTVGFAGTPINKILALRQAPVCVKPEGLFGYSNPLDRWVNYTPTWQGFMHPDNGKGAYSLGDSILVPIGGGGAILWDGFEEKPFDPLSLNSHSGYHTTSGELETVSATRHWVVGTTFKAPKMSSAGESLRVFHYDNTTTAYTDHTTNLRDSNTNTSATMVINETTDELLIGWARPFSSIHIEMGGTVNAVVSTMTVSVGTGTDTWTTNTHRDFTDVSGAPLAKSGAIVFTEDPVAQNSWIQTAENGVTLYWARLTFSQSLTNNFSLRGVRIQPWFPSVDNTDFPDDGLDRSGNYPHVLFGRVEKQSNVWHDMGGLPSPDDIGAILVSDIGGSSKNQNRSLIMIGRFDTWVMEMPPEDHPPKEVFPFTHPRGIYEGSAIVPKPGSSARLVSVSLNGQEFDPSTFRLQFYYTWDYGKPWSKAGSKILEMPADIDVVGGQSGSTFRWLIGMRNATSNFPPGQPVISSIQATFEIEEGPLDRVQERVLQTQTRF